MPETEFGVAGAYRIIKKSGAERVGDDAAQELLIALEEIGQIISRQAIEFALHAGRRTVKSSDIKLAVKSLKI